MLLRDWRALELSERIVRIAEHKPKEVAFLEMKINDKLI